MAEPSESEMMADLAAADAAGDTQLAQHIASRIKAARGPTQLGTAIRSAGQGLAWGAAPQLVGAYRAGEGQETGAPLETAGATLRGLWRKITGDPEAAKRYQAGKLAEQQALEAGRQAYPKTAFVGEVGGALLSPVTGLAPFTAGAGAPLLARSAASAGNAALGAGLYGFNASPEQALGGQMGDALRAAMAGGALGAAAPVVAAGVQRAGEALSPTLRNWAERAAVRSTNADRTASRRAFKGSEEARQKLGAYMLDEPAIKLRSPQAIKEGAEIAEDVYGPAIGKMAEEADKMGAKVNLRAAVDAAKASRPVSTLAKNTVTKTKYDEVTSMLEDQVKKHGDQVPPSVAHDIRMQLDQLSSWDQTAPAQVKEAWRAARRAVDDGLDQTMQGLQLKPGWDYLNEHFSMARKLSNPRTHRGLADIGTERNLGNRFGRPSEKIAGAAGVATTLAGGNPAALAMPLAMTALNRFGFPVTARTLDAASKALAAPSILGPVAEQPGIAAIMAQRLRLRAPQLELMPAVGEEGTEPGR